MLFSIVVFGSIVNEGYVNKPDEMEEYCIYNRNQNACNYGITVGVLAFLSCLLYLALDVYFPQISSVKDRKKAVLSDIGVSGFWAFLWFVSFCFLADQWRVSKKEDNPLNEGADAARAAIAFSFFSIFTWELHNLAQYCYCWLHSGACGTDLSNISACQSYEPEDYWCRLKPLVGQSFLAFQRYQLGADSALFSQDYMDPSQEAGMPYAPYTNEADTTDSMGTYQQPPSADAFDAETQGYQAQDY
ncbi:hypothetical protein JD844_028322 [Phrynosoma platyrhinos]|uniref:Synaptogyrin n=1 Tax=Phrynosoma platyrhinos TaxID=52577 RepID=A0ABQ7SHP4_PHRPL|nr:hypothetical protein JD844_028322 [Phrynosoma platyrhinos]